MKILCFFPILLILWLQVKGQNFPACDSLVIACCTPDIIPNPNTLSLTVTNYSSVLFDYPGFVLFDSNMDTIAKEQVNYFGIGTFPQIHQMNIVAPITLPFTGILNLYILFYDTLACSFPVTIPDISIGISPVNANKNINLFPNPVTNSNKLFLSTDFILSEMILKIYNMQGSQLLQHLLKTNNSGEAEINISALPQGVYYLQAESNGRNYSAKFIK